MACGRPVVATNVGGVADVVKNRESGILISSGDLENMAKAIVELLKDPAQAEKMGESGRQRVKKTFTVDRLLEDISRLYLVLLKDKEISV